MALIQNVRTESEQRIIDEVMGSSWSNIQSFESWREACVVAAKRKALVRVVREFDEYCEKLGVKYFAMANTLKGIVSYEGFLPGAADVELGMMRADYKKFARAYQAAFAEAGGEPFSFWRLDEFDDLNGNALRRFPRLRVRKGQLVTFEGDPVFDAESLPIEVAPYVEISIFDEVPDDFFMRKKFYRQMKRRNDLFNNVTKAREILFNRFDPDLDSEVVLQRVQSLSYPVALLYSLVPLRLASKILRSKAQRYEGRNTECVCRVMGSRSKTVYASDLGECTHRPFCGIMVRCPDRPDVWAPAPVTETTPELRRLQEDALAIVAEIDRVCQELGIGYFCCGGTMLGHVRHGGFIPWDDDIDVGMLRADYEVFKAHAAEVIDTERFFVQTRESDPNIPYLFSKVRMNGTEYITEYNQHRDFHKGICVDVFPFDYVPNGRPGQEKQVLAAKKAARAHHAVVNRQYPEYFQESTEPRHDLDWFIAQKVGRVAAKRNWDKSLKDTQHAYDAVATRHNKVAAEKKYRYVASFIPTYTMARVEGDLLPFQRVKFDGITVNLPARPEAFLRMQYGDYLVWPYPHQRAGHDLLLWSDEEGVGGGRMAE